MNDNDSQIDEQLQQMRESAAALLNRCYFKSALQRNAETARFAKGNQRLIVYIYSRFHQMDQAQYVLDPKQMRECAIELIPLLEDEERARAFQSDFDDAYYEGTKQWMTACLYENLAEATGHTDGYNSDGMHQCIADGLQVCRRTGKLACISCFREYATDVYTAADDTAMARHQCQTVLSHKGSWSDRGDRRWFVSTKVAWLDILEGNVTAAVEADEKALKLTNEDEVSLKLESRLRALVELDTARILAGEERVDWSNPDSAGKADWLPPDGEWPVMDMKRQLNDALQYSCQGDFDEAIKILSDWDRTLDRQSCLNAWFDVRLRLIAAFRMSGKSDRIQRLANQLEERAKKAGDFLSLRRLKRLMDDSIATNPIASLAPLDCGPFSDDTASAIRDETPVAARSSSDDNAEETSDAATKESYPGEDEFQEKILDIVRRISTAEDEAVADDAKTELLSYTVDAVDHPRQASMLLHFARMFAGEDERDAEIWTWAQQFQEKFPDASGVLSLTAALGNVVRYGPVEELQDSIDGEQIEKLFRRAITNDPNGIGAHLLAGEHFLFSENHGEAERCLARAFRLDRTNSSAALRLSEVYLQTDRPRDALNVLDLCLREGGDEANVAWEALVQAIHARQFEAALTYADRFDEMQPDETGVNYYRATALVELGRHEESLAAVDAELAFEPDESIHLDAVRGCAFFGSGQTDKAREILNDILDQPFGQLTFLTRNGLNQVLDLIWRHTSTLSDEDPLQNKLRQRLLVTGMLPDSLFDDQRVGRPEETVNFYQVLAEQRVSENWSNSLGCLAGQDHWKSYRIVWGVLAPNEEAARQWVLGWQNQCEDEPAEIVEVALDGEGYRDRAGVVWQGMRWNDSEDEDSV